MTESLWDDIVMKILIVPMAALAETHGPSSRCGLLAKGFRDAGTEVATCMAEDVNFRSMEGVPNWYLDVPMPLGLPKGIAKRTFPIAQKLGITAKKTVNSFDQVLRFTGNLDYGYLKKSVSSVRKAIREFRPDLVYSEFNLSAVIAARKEEIPLCATVSYPTQYEYAHETGPEKGLNRLLGELRLPQVDSALRLFDWADRAFCPSIRELEPIEKPNVFYCGALKTGNRKSVPLRERNKILVYMGNGTISAQETRKTAETAFKDLDFEVYLASAYLKEETRGNLRIAPRWDFDRLLGEAVLFMNHGGQNSVADGLLYGVPQIVVPGKVFERKYNAGCLAAHQAGIVIDHADFSAESVRAAAERIFRSGEMAENAAALGRKLAAAGGVDAVVREITKR